MDKDKREKAWVITTDMGYGHQRTSYPLRNLAPDSKVISANNYEEIPTDDEDTWERGQKFYDFVSNFKSIPLIGDLIFGAFDVVQKILPFYPKRDLTKPNLVLKQYYSLISKGWGKDLIDRLEEKNLPLITTFFIPAFMAEEFDYDNDIYCQVCDTDIARIWAPLNSKKSRIKYFAPTERVKERLELYGVNSSNIYLTGFPLPERNLEHLKEDLKHRLVNLDPKGNYRDQYYDLIESRLGNLPSESNHPLTIMFAVGGAGAQSEIGVQIVKNLKEKLEKDELRIILVAATHKDVRDHFRKQIKKIGIEKNVEILYKKDINDYFEEFNKRIRKTDILWTKPSELSFYSALGIPLLLAPTIGSQEDFNKRWILKSGFGNTQKNPRYADQWLFNWIEKGYFAEFAMEGFVEGRQDAVKKIKKIIG